MGKGIREGKDASAEHALEEVEEGLSSRALLAHHQIADLQLETTLHDDEYVKQTDQLAE